MQIAEMIVCLLAVFGLYTVLCRVLSLFCRKEKLSLAVHIENDKEITEAASDRLREAVIMTESENGRLMPPVILLARKPNGEEIGLLRGFGFPIYYREGGEN